MPQGLTEASRLFDELNRRYWRGRLPRYRIIRRAKLPDHLAYCRNETRTIVVRADLAGNDLRLTILHEMCHIGSDGGRVHGALFQRKMRRLVGLGVPKLTGDLERYDGTADQREFERHIAAGGSGGIDDRPLRVIVSEDLENIAMSNPNRRWSWIRRYLAHVYKLSLPQVDRLMPWAQKEWRRLSAEWREHEAVRSLQSDVFGLFGAGSITKPQVDDLLRRHPGNKRRLAKLFPQLRALLA